MKARFFQRITLTMKMVLLTVIVGISMWAVLDYFQTRTIRGIFLAQLKERLNREAQEDRIRFDNYIKAHHQSVKLIASQKQFVDYIVNKDWANAAGIISYEQTPPWMPTPSILRSLVQISYALLMDKEGKTREIYKGIPDTLPEPLLNPTDLMRQLSHNQSFMTYINDEPFLVTSESVTDSQNSVLATLMLASPLNEEFLIASHGPYHGRIFALLTFALLTGEKAQILVSTDPDRLPAGALLEDLESRYLVTGKSLFDYGSSDLLLGFASFVSVEEVESLTRPVISRDRRQRAISSFILISAFALIMFWITKRIVRLTGRISDFSERMLHGKPRTYTYGDEMHILEERFHQLTNEVISSQEIIKRNYHFQSTISSILQLSLEPVSLNEQLERILDVILSIPFLSVKSMGSIYLVEDEPDVLVMKTQRGMPKPMQDVCAKVTFGECLCGLAVSDRKVVFAECTDKNHVKNHEDIMPDYGHYCVPIISVENVLGVMNLYLEEGHKRDPEEEGLLSSVANTLAGVIERKQAEQEKQKLKEQLVQAEKLSALGRLTANVAHEIRNPLTSIGGYARRLDKRISEGTKEKECAEIIITEVSRLERILKNVLTYSREDHLSLDYYDICEIIDESIKTYEIICKESSITIVKSIADVQKILIDKDKVIEVMNNIISNAIDSMLNGGTLTIDSRNEMLHGKPYLLVKINDTGKGIPDDKAKMVFEPFFTTKLLEHGTGLGLAICKKIMEDHGGFIRFESRVGTGSSFSLYFPS